MGAEKVPPRISVVTAPGECVEGQGAARSRSGRPRGRGRGAVDTADPLARCALICDLQLAIDIASRAVVAPSAGPGREIAALARGLKGQSVSEWMGSARVSAILGSCPKSWASVASGVRCWAKFAMSVLDMEPDAVAPPTADGLAMWSTCFRCGATYANYLSHLRLACVLVRAPVDAFDHPAIKRAKQAIVARATWQPRPKMFIRESLLVRVLQALRGVQHGRQLSMLFLCAYAFLLRLPSEALPIVVGSTGAGAEEVRHKCVILPSETCVSLKLAWRKNRRGPSTLSRSCWCKRCQATCPVHVLGPFLASFPVNASPFAQFRPPQVLAIIRETLQGLGVPDAQWYRTHDFRRGHAQDLATRGARLAEILRAGDWKSASFLQYLDRDELEGGAVEEAHGVESSSDDASEDSA